MTTPAAALAKLQNHPDRFLRNYYVMVERHMHQAGQTNYWFGGTGYVTQQGNDVYNRTARPGRFLGSLNMHASKNFKFSPHQNALIGAPTQTPVWHIDVMPSAGLALGAIPGMPVSRTAGPPIMVTTLLNGCTFICAPDVNDVHMAHIQPTGGTSAAALETSVINGGALVGVGAPTVFGGGRCYTAAYNDVTILGVRQGTQWRLFAQIHPRNQRHTSGVVEFFNG